MFHDWSYKHIPHVFWLAAFTYPTGFTTALLQKFSRKQNGAPIDKLDFDYPIIKQNVKNIMEPAKDGAYIMGLYLEGAKWNFEKECLDQPETMELQSPMPIIHFKPITKRPGRAAAKMFDCPCYYYPIRQGTIDRESFMFRVDLKTGDYPKEFWVKRGTALLMSLAD